MMRMMGRAAAVLAVLAGLAVEPAAAEMVDKDGAPARPAPESGAPTWGAPAPQVQCGGRDLMADLPADRRAEIDREVAGTPFARGVRWTARRGPARIEIVGTYHLDDPRIEPIAQAIAPALAGAGALLVEAGPAEERTLREALA